MITPNLIGKCLLIGGAGAATGTGIYFIQKSYFSYNKELKELAEKVGLICEGNPTETSGVECSKKEGDEEKVKVKLGASDTFDAKTISGGKIKVYLKSKDEEYNKDFKFVIEDGDVTTNDNTKKLEQFETYEIKEESDKKHYLIRKNEAKTEIKKALGLPAEDACNFPTSSTEVSCTLGADKIKKVKFDGVTKEPEVKDASGATITLKISKVSEAPFNGGGYKFVLESNKEINLGDSKSIKKGTNTEFKIKKENGSLTLEKAWTVKSLGEKVGLVCPETVTNEAGECTLGESINVNNNGASESNKKHAGLTKKDDAAGKKKVKFEIDHGHNQGFKFFTEETNGIELKNGTGASAGSDESSKKIEPKGNAANNPVTYEIKKDTDNKWYLTKKTTTESQ